MNAHNHPGELDKNWLRAAGKGASVTRQRTVRYRRNAFSLIELLVATGAASILLVGLVSAIAIAARAFEVPQSQKAIELSKATLDLSLVAGTATQLPTQTASSISFLVPDRDADQVSESIEVSFGGTAGGPLNLSQNSATPVPLLPSVASFSSQTNTITLPSRTVPTVPTVQFVGFSESKVKKAEQISIQQPAGTSPGNLLILVVAIHDPDKDSLEASGWTELVNTENGHVTLGVWWKNASSSTGTHEATWSKGEDAYAAMLTFSGHNTTAPIGAGLYTIGTSDYPTIPSVTTSVDESMILCIGGFHKGDIYADRCGVTGAYSVTMDHSESQISVGAAIVPKPHAGTFSERSFLLSESQDYVCVTIAITPS